MFKTVFTTIHHHKVKYNVNSNFNHNKPNRNDRHCVF